MTQYTDEIRMCIRDGCDRTFRVKVKGQTQVYCSPSCRAFVYHTATPERREIHRAQQRAYYYRNQKECQARARSRSHRRCECGRLKATVKDAMCADCAAIAPVGNRP